MKLLFEMRVALFSKP